MDETLYDWARRAARELELAEWTGERETVQLILDLARDVAHGVARPAAPVAAFLAGVAVGREGGADPEALTRAAAAITPDADA